MAIRKAELYHTKDSYLVYDWRADKMWLTKQFTTLENRGKKVNPKEYRCRLYSLGTKKSLRGQVIMTGTYDECIKEFKRRFSNEYLELQLQIAPKGRGVDTYLDNKDDYYSFLYNQKCKANRNADRSRFWRCGDSPWEAPGMSMYDFI